MSDIQIPFAQLLAGYFQQPQKVEHVYHGSPQSPAQGSPVQVAHGDPIDMGDYDVILNEGMEEGYGDPLEIDETPVVFGSPNTELDYVSVPQDAAYGNIFSNIRNAMASTARSTRSAGASAVNSVKGVAMRNRRQINKNSASIKRNQRNISRALRLQSARVAKKMQTSEKNKWMAAVLAAAQALPGVKSYNVLTSDASKGTFAGLAAFFTELRAHYPEEPTAVTLDAVTAATGGEAAAIDVVAGELAARDDVLVARINAIEEAIWGSIDKSQDEKLSTHIETFRKQAVADSLTDIAALIPSQFEVKDAALLEAGVKYVLGKEGDGTSGFNFSIG